MGILAPERWEKDVDLGRLGSLVSDTCSVVVDVNGKVVDVSVGIEVLT